MAFPTQRYESFFEGHIEALEFFGGAPGAFIYDNLRTAVKEGWGKHVREQQTPFKLLMARKHRAVRLFALMTVWAG